MSATQPVNIVSSEFKADPFPFLARLNKLLSEPSLVKPAVEELLRYTSPVFTTTERYPREDTMIHGVTIPRGEMTLGVIGSANRDETAFENPNDLQTTREPTRCRME